MRTFHLNPDTRERASLVLEEIERLLGEGKHIVVTVAEERARSVDALGAPLD